MQWIFKKTYHFLHWIMKKKYINRLIDTELENWRISDSRKPLLLRGARQVGLVIMGTKIKKGIELKSIQNF